MERRLYKCEIPDCGREVSIRSTIKTGEHKGKKTCSICKHMTEGKNPTRKALKPFTEKRKSKRKAEREGLPKFFEEQIAGLEQIRSCQNCGCFINVNYEPIRNIAHILPKSKYKSVMTHPLNALFLCSDKDQGPEGDCHYKFDNNIKDIPKMKCFSVAKNRFELFKDEVVERGIIFRIFEENK